MGAGEESVVIIIGLLLIAVAVAAVTGVAVSSSTVVPVHVFGHSARPHEVGVVFVTGAIAGVVFAIGCWLVLSSMSRRRARRRDRKRTQRAQLAEQRALRERNAELEQTLASEQTAQPIDLNKTEHSYADHRAAP
jgi:uncharacterized membrane protein YciS (DUF1049 family)